MTGKTVLNTCFYVEKRLQGFGGGGAFRTFVYRRNSMKTNSSWMKEKEKKIFWSFKDLSFKDLWFKDRRQRFFFSF